LILNKLKCFLGQIHIQDAVMVPNWWATFNQGIYKLKNKVTNSQHYMKTSFILLIWINYSLWNNKTLKTTKWQESTELNSFLNIHENVLLEIGS
jgi:hypothetical protein